MGGLLHEVVFEVTVVAVVDDEVVVVTRLHIFVEMHDVRVVYRVHDVHLAFQMSRKRCMTVDFLNKKTVLSW